MKRIALYFIISMVIMSIFGCNKNNLNEEKNNKSSIDVIIDNVKYEMILEDNNTSKEFLEILPQEFTMNELNNNEKYVYMDKSFTTDSFKPNYINAGDVMLYGDNCLVIFYKSFETNYKYTKIGHINNLNDIGTSNIVVSFSKKG